MPTSPSRSLVARGERMVDERNKVLRAMVALLQERDGTLRPVDRVAVRSAAEMAEKGFWDDDDAED